MWITGTSTLWPAAWFRSLVTWVITLARSASAQLRRTKHRRREHAPQLRSSSKPALREHVATSASAQAVMPTAPQAPLGMPTRTAALPAHFNEADIEQAVSLLQAAGGLLVLDLCEATYPPLERCTAIASTWPSERVTSTPHTRLAILVKFEHWVLMRSLLASELALLATKGVQAVLCYEEQSWDAWFLRGQIVHDVARVLPTLRGLVERQSNPVPPSHWRLLLTTAASFLDGSQPGALCELARIALDCGANQEALDFANEAAEWANQRSVLECRALRLLGVAMMRQGLGSGAHAIEDAFNLALDIGATTEAAEALQELERQRLATGTHVADVLPTEHLDSTTARDHLEADRTN